jgi:hypothetical protein
MKKFIFIIFISIFIFMIGSKTIIAQKPFSNPALIYGSDFMSFMQSLKKVGDYNMLLQFTSSASIKKNGEEKTKTYYEEKFTNMSKLKLQSIVNNSNGTKTMNYTNMKVATKSSTFVTIIIENDSCKLVLPVDLSKKLLN